MDVKPLREILRLFEKSGLQSLEVRQGEDYVRLSRPEVDRPAQPAPVKPLPLVEAAPDMPDAGPDFNHIIEVKSPVVGVYYEAAEPGGKPFVQPGDSVRQGDVLCLVEVMKQVTEVTAPQDARVADVCVQNGSVVEFGQTLIKLY